jgi:hypothetical protein
MDLFKDPTVLRVHPVLEYSQYQVLRVEPTGTRDLPYLKIYRREIIPLFSQLKQINIQNNKKYKPLK